MRGLRSGVWEWEHVIVLSAVRARVSPWDSAERKEEIYPEPQHIQTRLDKCGSPSNVLPFNLTLSQTHTHTHACTGV